MVTLLADVVHVPDELMYNQSSAGVGWDTVELEVAVALLADMSTELPSDHKKVPSVMKSLAPNQTSEGEAKKNQKNIKQNILQKLFLPSFLIKVFSSFVAIDTSSPESLESSQEQAQRASSQVALNKSLLFTRMMGCY